MCNETKPLIEVKNLTIDFATEDGWFNAVRDISFSIGRNESVAVIGESGSGKSVTANAILGLLDCPPGRISQGSIRFDGEDLLTMPIEKRRRLYGRRIAMVFQDPLIHLNPVYPIGWQISEVCRIHGMSKIDADARMLELLKRVDIPDPPSRALHYPHQFSGGQRQRIMIAMAMAFAPDLLIADEPTTALDVTVQAQILELLRDLRTEMGMSLLMITHDLGVAADIADHVLVMKKGEIVERGATASVFSGPQHAYTRQLLADRSEAYRSEKPAAPELILEMNNLNISYGAFHAVKNVSLRVGKGEIVGVVGESGSGKSSLAGAVLGLRDLSSGSVEFYGKDIRQFSKSESKEYNRSVQAVFQDPYSSLNPRMTVLAILSEPWELHPDVVSKKERAERAGELLEMVGLSRADLVKYPNEFSGGQRQRIAIARALALEPKIIVCDEAVSALDMTIQAQVIALLAELRTKLKVSYLFIAHDLTLVRKFADRVVVMKNGEVVEEGDSETVFANPSHPYTRKLVVSSPVPDPILQKQRRAQLITA